MIMAQNTASKQLIKYDRQAPDTGKTWHCSDCGTFIDGREGYDRHVSCFPNHHPQPDVNPEARPPATR
jgi:hypothetical protein